MTPSVPQVIVIGGPNGAGKSTLAPHFLRDALGLVEYVNADTIAQGLAAFSPESVAFEAGRVMLKRLHSLADRNQSFSFESTLATRSYVKWLSRLRRQGYKVHFVFLWVRSADLAICRVRERVKLGGHGVPDEVIRRRYSRGLKNFLDIYTPLADTWALFDNSEAGEPERIAAGQRNGTITILHARAWGEVKKASE